MADGEDGHEFQNVFKGAEEKYDTKQKVIPDLRELPDDADNDNRRGERQDDAPENGEEAGAVNTRGFREIGWTAGFMVCAFLSFSLLDKAAKVIPLGTAYAVWVGIGAVGTLAVGVATGAESLGIVRMALVAGLIACVVGLKFAGNH